MPRFTGNLLPVVADSQSIGSSGARVATMFADALDLGSQSTLTPTITFATPGDLTVSYASQIGYFYRVGKLVYVYVALVFTPTYTTASGVLRISAPVNGASAISSPLNIVAFSLTWPSSSTMLQAIMSGNSAFFVMQGLKSASAASTVATGTIVSGTACTLTFSGVYLSQ